MHEKQNQPIDEQAVAKYYTELFKNIPIEQFAKKHNLSESTIKNICSGKTSNPGILTLADITYPAHGSLDAIFNKDNEALKESAINAIKDMYEFHSEEITKTNETHINNIRAHYEHHRQDYKEHTEHRLADKREIIEQQNEHIKTLKKELFLSKIFTCIGFGILILLLILEVTNPSLGWIKF